MPSGFTGHAGRGPISVPNLFDGIIVLTGASSWFNVPDSGADVVGLLQALLPNASVFGVWDGNATYDGVGGSPSMLARLTDIDTHYSSTRRRRVYCGSAAELVGINDHQPRTAAQEKAACVAYVSAVKALHATNKWEVWPAGCIATTENTAANPPDYQSIRDTYNSLIAADFAGGDGYLNLPSVALLQNPNNPAVFFDGVAHLMLPGRTAVATYMASIP